jgi:hypothetical protein
MSQPSAARTSAADGGPVLDRLRRVLDGRGFVLLRGVPVKIGRSPVPPSIGASAALSAAPAQNAHVPARPCL